MNETIHTKSPPRTQPAPTLHRSNSSQHSKNTHTQPRFIHFHSLPSTINSHASVEPFQTFLANDSINSLMNYQPKTCSQERQEQITSSSLIESYYQLIDEALKDCTSSLGLIWSTSANQANSGNILPISSFEGTHTSSPNTSLTPPTSQIPPLNRSSQVEEPTRKKRKKNAKHESPQTIITYEMSDYMFPEPSHVTNEEHGRSRKTVATDNNTKVDKRRKYKVRFGPNMFEEINYRTHNPSHKFFKFQKEEGSAEGNEPEEK